MSASFSWHLQKIIVEQLRQNVFLDAYVHGRVYDVVPPQPEFPYIVLGQDGFQSWNSKTSHGCTCYLVLHVFSKGKGRKELKEIVSTVEQSLNKKSIGLEDVYLVQLSADSIQTYIESDQMTCHGIVRVKVLAQFK